MNDRRVWVRLGLLLALTVTPASAGAQEREIVLLHTNDFHSAIDPVVAFWMDGEPLIGGAAHIKTMVDSIREREAENGTPVYLFDAGDMFTGLLSRLTYGEILMEMMITMGYDALGVGNHEFDYGWENFREQMYRAPFPVLSANTFYRGTDILFTQPHAIIEKNGLRVGVIGIIGRDAMSVVVPSLVSELEFRDPEPYVRASVAELEPRVDLVVVLAHQGRTGPMQTDQEAYPELWRDFDEDIRLTTAVRGIDVFLGGHAHRGIDPPYVNPKTGTIIVQTFGFGTRVAMLRLRVDTSTGEVVAHEGELMVPFAADHAADPVMEEKMDAYKARFSTEIETVVGRLQARLVRRYNEESPLGSFVADVMREVTGAEVGFINAGGLRADLSGGEVTLGHLRDALPFLNSVVTMDLTGAQIATVLEQGLTLERGLIQVSGLEATYALARPPGERLLSLRIGGEEADPSRAYRVVTVNFLAEGGDLYSTFVGAPWITHDERAIGDILIEWFRDQSSPGLVPAAGRLIPVDR